MKLELVFEPHAGSVRTHVFVGGVRAGELVMPEPEWLRFTAALVSGGRAVGLDVQVAPARPEQALQVAGGSRG